MLFNRLTLGARTTSMVFTHHVSVRACARLYIDAHLAHRRALTDTGWVLI
jgi:hypothetical protein